MYFHIHCYAQFSCQTLPRLPTEPATKTSAKEGPLNYSLALSNPILKNKKQTDFLKDYLTKPKIWVEYTRLNEIKVMFRIYYKINIKFWYFICTMRNHQLALQYSNVGLTMTLYNTILLIICPQWGFSELNYNQIMMTKYPITKKKKIY